MKKLQCRAAFPAFLAPGTGFVEDSFSTDGGGGMVQAVTRAMGSDGERWEWWGAVGSDGERWERWGAMGAIGSDGSSGSDGERWGATGATGATGSDGERRERRGATGSSRPLASCCVAWFLTGRRPQTGVGEPWYKECR